MRINRRLSLRIAVGVAGLFAVLAVACGGSSDDDAGSSPAGSGLSASPAITPTSTPLPRRTPTPKPPPTPAPGVDELISEGKLLYEKTAGGTGCAICHGIDAKGDEVIGAPDNRGVTANDIWDALDRVQNMAYITLSNAEARALEAYLGFLATQP